MKKTTGIKAGAGHAGFSLIEVMIAMVILMVGVVSVAQMVPASLKLNSESRLDSTALVIGQRELNALIEQPLSAASFTDPLGNLCSLGSAASPKTLVGSPVLMLNNQPVLDFSGTQVAGYSFNYTDPNDPFRAAYDVRWAVFTYVSGGKTTGKRFLLGVLRRGGNGAMRPVTLDTMVEQ